MRLRPSAAVPRAGSPLPALARYGLLVPLLAGALLLIVAEFSPLYEIRAIEAVLESPSAGGRHGYALLVIGLALAPMSWGAVVGGARPAAFAALALAVAAALVVVLSDLPDVNDAGLYARTYELVEASPASGFWLECAGAGLALLGAVGAVLLRPGAREGEAATRASATA